MDREDDAIAGGICCGAEREGGTCPDPGSNISGKLSKTFCGRTWLPRDACWRSWGWPKDVVEPTNWGMSIQFSEWMALPVMLSCIRSSDFMSSNQLWRAICSVSESRGAPGAGSGALWRKGKSSPIESVDVRWGLCEKKRAGTQRIRLTPKKHGRLGVYMPPGGHGLWALLYAKHGFGLSGESGGEGAAKRQRRPCCWSAAVTRQQTTRRRSEAA